MVSKSFPQREIVRDILEQILGAIDNLQTWNASLSDVDELLSSPEGMKTLAADCMLIEAIGEGFKKIDHKTDGKLLSCRPEIPWRQVIGMRDHIAHGYFDINIDYVWDVLQNDLVPLRAATEYFLEHLEELL